MITPLAVVSVIYGPVNGRILARFGARPCLAVAAVAYVTRWAGRTATAVAASWASPDPVTPAVPDHS
jgi:hypothetical protein